MALLVLFDRGLVRHLPQLWALRTDHAPTFAPPPPPLGRSLHGHSAPMTVGLVATKCVQLYVRAAPMPRAVPSDSQVVDPERDAIAANQEFDAFWTGRKDRPQSACWLAVELLRACAGSRPAPATCAAAIAAVKQKILAHRSVDAAQQFGPGMAVARTAVLGGVGRQTDCGGTAAGRCRVVGPAVRRCRGANRAAAVGGVGDQNTEPRVRRTPLLVSAPKELKLERHADCA